MLRRIIKIDEKKCNGCGLCASACHEGAIAMVDGKARLIREDYCDGLGDCLPACPTGAISFEEREAAAYDAEAVARHLEGSGGCCPGAQARTMTLAKPCDTGTPAATRLGQWPVQIQLAPLYAPYFDGAHLLIAADCAAYAYGDFHNRFMDGKITLIGCPKLDHVDYGEKLTEILRQNRIASITVARMEVPCCGGLEHAVKRAIAQSGKEIPLRVETISIRGDIL